MKALIFDQDRTLYPLNSKLTKELSKLTKKWFQDSLNIPDGDINQFYKSLPNMYPLIYDAINYYHLELNNYFENVFGKINLEGLISKNELLIKFLSSQNIPIYVVTLAPLEYSKRLQSFLGLIEYITDTFSVCDYNPMKKVNVYESIRKELKLNTEDILVVGDNFETDLREAQEQSYKTALINEKYCVKNSFRDINEFIHFYQKNKL